jgi:hypothetical protein
MGFKEQEQPHRERPRSLQVPPRRVIPARPRNTQTAQTTGVIYDRANESSQRRDAFSAKPLPVRPASLRHSPETLQAEPPGGGRGDKPLKLEPNRHEKTNDVTVASVHPASETRCYN